MSVFNWLCAVRSPLVVASFGRKLTRRERLRLWAVERGIDIVEWWPSQRQMWRLRKMLRKAKRDLKLIRRLEKELGLGAAPEGGE